jgi:S1-C subfamily serine protease
MKRLLVLVLVCVTVFFTAEASRFWRDKLRPQSEEIEIVINKAPYIPYQDEYEQMLYPTVRISSSCGTGSGVIFHRRDAKDAENTAVTATANTIYILTAAHVVGDESSVTIEFFYPVITKIDASVIITDTAKDFALLRALGVPASPAGGSEVNKATLAPKDYTPYIFTPVYSVGCSLGLPPRPSEGIISVIDTDHWEVSSPILPGNSGGPVYDAHTYEVIGIAVWVKVYNGQLVTTMAGIVPINQIYNFLDNYEKLSKPGDASR